MQVTGLGTAVGDEIAADALPAANLRALVRGRYLVPVPHAGLYEVQRDLPGDDLVRGDIVDSSDYPAGNIEALARQGQMAPLIIESDEDAEEKRAKVKRKPRQRRGGQRQ